MRWRRGLLFLLLAAWMLGSPFYRQVLDGENPYVREWRMYGTRAVRTCEVRFEVQRDATWEPVSRWELEGYSYQRFPSRRQRMLDTTKAAQAAGRRLCAAVDGPLRYRRRCGDVRDGWGDWRVEEVACE